jgi:hypothetical protein
MAVKRFPKLPVAWRAACRESPIATELSANFWISEAAPPKITADLLVSSPSEVAALTAVDIDDTAEDARPAIADAAAAAPDATDVKS